MNVPPSGNRDRYNRLAPSYEALLRLGSLGQVSRLYRAVRDALDLRPGATVVEFGCGPATVTPYLRSAVGPTGSVIGVDIAEEMIARARRKAEQRGWTGVRFECCGTCDFEVAAPVDAVVFCLALTVMPDWERCLEHAVAMLVPGGQLVVLDSFPQPGRFVANLMVHLKAPLVGATPIRAPLEWITAKLDDVRERDVFRGMYTLLAARKPASA